MTCAPSLHRDAHGLRWECACGYQSLNHRWEDRVEALHHWVEHHAATNIPEHGLQPSPEDLRAACDCSESDYDCSCGRCDAADAMERQERLSEIRRQERAAAWLPDVPEGRPQTFKLKLADAERQGRQDHQCPTGKCHVSGDGPTCSCPRPEGRSPSGKEDLSSCHPHCSSRGDLHVKGCPRWAGIPEMRLPTCDTCGGLRLVYDTLRGTHPCPDCNGSRDGLTP